MTYTPRQKVGYYYDPEVGNFYYAQGHPMKPHRIRMTHNLLISYGIFDKMDILPTPRATDREMTRFHSDEYINFLKIVSPETLTEHISTLSRFNVLEDCPVFDGLWQYCQIAAGGSLSGAARLNAGESTIAINWAGGLHHAKKAEASGFCYINDCVLAILELLKVHPRVLYVDIDIHHGDGVEEAFYTTDRVMTASFHKFGDYFPGTGDVVDVGIGKGKYYSANFPLRDGIDDESYRSIFVPVMTKIMQWYQPGAVVLQCGADSLTGDRLGCFNLSLDGHAQCVDFFKSYDVPLLMLGGGGYTIRNVARCWAYETSRVVGETLPDNLPYNENYEFYGPEFRLHVVPSNMENHNSESELHNTTMKIMEHLRHLPHAPSVPIMDTPRRLREEDEEEDLDVRQRTRRAKYVVDYEDSSEEEDDQYISSLRRAKRKAKRMKFPRRHFPMVGSRTSVDRNRSRGILSESSNGLHRLLVPDGSATAVVRENGGIGGAERDNRTGTDSANGLGGVDGHGDGSMDGEDAGDKRDESGRGRSAVNSNVREERVEKGHENGKMEIETTLTPTPTTTPTATPTATREAEHGQDTERESNQKAGDTRGTKAEAESLERSEGRDEGGEQERDSEMRDVSSEKSDGSATGRTPGTADAPSAPSGLSAAGAPSAEGAPAARADSDDAADPAAPAALDGSATQAPSSEEAPTTVVPSTAAPSKAAATAEASTAATSSGDAPPAAGPTTAPQTASGVTNLECDEGKAADDPDAEEGDAEMNTSA